MLELLEKKKVPLKRIKVNPAKTTPIMSQLQSICAECPDIKYLGEKALVCYLRSVWLQKNKEVFDVNKLPIEEFAASLGLPGAPKVKFVRKLKAEKNQSRAEVNAEKRMADVGRAADVRASVDKSDEEDIESEDEVEEKAPTGKKHATEVVAAADDSSSDSEAAPGKQRTRLDKLFAKKNQSLLWDHSEKMKERGEDSLIGGTALADGDDGFLTLARADHELEGVPTMAPGFLERPLSVRDKRSIKTKARVLKNNDANPSKMVFDEDGTVSSRVARRMCDP